MSMMISPQEVARRAALKAQHETSPGHAVYTSLFGRRFGSMPDVRGLERSLRACLKKSYAEIYTAHHDIRELCQGLKGAGISDSTIKLMIRDLGNATFERRAPGLLVPQKPGDKLEQFSPSTRRQAYTEVYSGYVDGVGSPGPSTALVPLPPGARPGVAMARPAGFFEQVPWWGWLIAGAILVRAMR